MDGDDGAEAGLTIGAKDHLLVAIPVDVLEQIHACSCRGAPLRLHLMVLAAGRAALKGRARSAEEKTVVSSRKTHFGRQSADGNWVRQR